jgi:hypothetical protein
MSRKKLKMRLCSIKMIVKATEGHKSSGLLRAIKVMKNDKNKK